MCVGVVWDVHVKIMGDRSLGSGYGLIRSIDLLMLWLQFKSSTILGARARAVAASSKLGHPWSI